MKKIFSTIKILVFLGVLASITSCEDFMTTETNRYMLADDNLINSPNDTVYSIIGILGKVQKLSDKYVLLGELRGDLLDVTDKAETDLRNLNNFTVDINSSEFADVKDYYGVINNCNYFIQRADTNLTDKGKKSFVKEVAVAKSIRAWTYMQLVLNYGKAYYFNKPILTISEAKQSYPELDQVQVIDTLISELSALNPVANKELPVYGTINGTLATSYFINTLFVLGDLHLWRASFNHSVDDYEKAAYYYAKLIQRGNYLIGSTPSVYWYNDTYQMPVDYWSSMFAGSSELISLIKLASTASDGTTGKMASLCSDIKVTSSKNMDDLFASQVYCYSEGSASTSKFTTGDLRAKGAISKKFVSDESTTSTTMLEPEKYISKFNYNIVNLYRVGLLYLRYAEAVNRAGKPGLAFAVLKYGLNTTNLKVSNKYVPSRDLADNKEYYTLFQDAAFDSNVGIHNRGCGASNYNTFYVIPDSTQLKAENMDSIMYVENAICDELALETGFEGNRFQDLMRFSNHRNDPSFLATKVAKKHVDYNSYFNLLMDKNNWFVPTKKY